MVLPYVPSMTEKFFTIIKNINVKLSFFSLNKLNKFIKVQKDILSKFSNKNVVYKIPCKDCDAYVGQKGRKLFTIFEQSLIAITRSNQRSQTTNLVSIMNLIQRISKFLIRKDFSINILQIQKFIYTCRRMEKQTRIACALLICFFIRYAKTILRFELVIG